jgi:hypothetical protein
LLGNLHQQSIKEIWARSTALQEVRRLSGQVDDFVRGLGKQGKEINFCPALAEQITGSPVRIYPSAALSLDILRRLDQGKEK